MVRFAGGDSLAAGTVKCVVIYGAVEAAPFQSLDCALAGRTSDAVSALANCSKIVRKVRRTSSAAVAFKTNFNMPSGVNWAPRWDGDEAG